MEEEIKSIIDNVSYTDYLNEDLSEALRKADYEFISNWLCCI